MILIRGSLVYVLLGVFCAQKALCSARFTSPLNSSMWSGNTIQSVCWTGFEGETINANVHLYIKAPNGGIADLGAVSVATGYHSVAVPGDLENGSYTFILKEKCSGEQDKNPAFPIQSEAFTIEQSEYIANPPIPSFVFEQPPKEKDAKESPASAKDQEMEPDSPSSAFNEVRLKFCYA